MNFLLRTIFFLFATIVFFLSLGSYNKIQAFTCSTQIQACGASFDQNFVNRGCSIDPNDSCGCGGPNNPNPSKSACWICPTQWTCPDASCGTGTTCSTYSYSTCGTQQGSCNNFTDTNSAVCAPTCAPSCASTGGTCMTTSRCANAGGVDNGGLCTQSNTVCCEVPTPTPTPTPSSCQSSADCGSCSQCCAGNPNYCSSTNFDCGGNIICNTPTPTPTPICTPGQTRTLCDSSTKTCYK